MLETSTKEVKDLTRLGGKGDSFGIIQEIKFDRTIKWYEVHTISCRTFFVWAFKIVVDPWEFSMQLLYILRDDRPIFMISASNEQLQQ